MKLADYIKKSKAITPSSFDKNIKIALLSNFTINGLTEILKVKCAKAIKMFSERHKKVKNKNFYTYGEKKKFKF